MCFHLLAFFLLFVKPLHELCGVLLPPLQPTVAVERTPISNRQHTRSLHCAVKGRNNILFDSNFGMGCNVSSGLVGTEHGGTTHARVSGGTAGGGTATLRAESPDHDDMFSTLAPHHSGAVVLTPLDGRCATQQDEGAGVTMFEGDSSHPGGRAASDVHPRADVAPGTQGIVADPYDRTQLKFSSNEVNVASLPSDHQQTQTSLFPLYHDDIGDVRQQNQPLTHAEQTREDDLSDISETSLTPTNHPAANCSPSGGLLGIDTLNISGRSPHSNSTSKGHTGGSGGGFMPLGKHHSSAGVNLQREREQEIPTVEEEFFEYDDIKISTDDVKSYRWRVAGRKLFNFPTAAAAGRGSVDVDGPPAGGTRRRDSRATPMNKFVFADFTVDEIDMIDALPPQPPKSAVDNQLPSETAFSSRAPVAASVAEVGLRVRLQ
jgi:hypothetical protein